MSRKRDARPGSESGTGATCTSSRAGGYQDDSAEAGFVAQLRRRRAAAWRCPPLGDTGHRDPYGDRRGALTVDELGAWLAAVDHLAAHGHAVEWAAPAAVRTVLGERAA